MRFPRNTKVFRGQLDPSPYACVFFLLVLFLLLSSSLVFTPGVPVRLPEGVDLPGTTNRVLVVAVEESGGLYYDGQIIEETALRDQLRNAARQSPEPLTLVVQADQGTRYEVLIRLSMLARDAGIKEALLATRPAVIPQPVASP